MHAFAFTVAQNASIQSLFSMLYRIMDGSIERNKRDLPHVWHSDYMHILYFLVMHGYFSACVRFLTPLFIQLYFISSQYPFFYFWFSNVAFFSVCGMSVEKDCRRGRVASFNSCRKLKKCKLRWNFFPLTECSLMYCA